jgi:hypothetical protein
VEPDRLRAESIGDCRRTRYSVLPETGRIKHGTRSMYSKGCGCSACRRADRLYQRGRKRP